MTRLILTSAMLLDGQSPARPNMTIVVAGDHIESISPARPDIHGSDRVVDLGGRTVMPGLVITHFHATYKDLGETPFASGMEAAPALQALRGARTLENLLQCGFTSAVSAGSPHAIDPSLKAAVNEGILKGSRLVPCSRDVSTTGHAADNSPWYWHLGTHNEPMCNCDGPDSFRKGVREEIRRGAEMIKLFATPGHAIPGRRGAMDISDDEMRAAVDAAHQRGVMIRSHVAHKEGILQSLDAGVDIIDHADGLDEECIERVLKAGAWIVPSLYFVEKVANTFLGKPFATHIRADIDQMLGILPLANRAGVKLTLGDDYGAIGLEHGRYAEEMEYYVKVAGIPALDVIKWGTVYGASMMRRDDLGCLRQGAIADLLVVDGDPVADIAILQDKSKLLAIMKDGVLMKDHLAHMQNNRAAAE